MAPEHTGVPCASEHSDTAMYRCEASLKVQQTVECVLFNEIQQDVQYITKPVQMSPRCSPACTWKIGHLNGLIEIVIESRDSPLSSYAWSGF